MPDAQKSLNVRTWRIDEQNVCSFSSINLHKNIIGASREACIKAYRDKEVPNKTTH
jgi:hypothetical protein